MLVDMKNALNQLIIDSFYFFIAVTDTELNSLYTPQISYKFFLSQLRSYRLTNHTIVAFAHSPASLSVSRQKTYRYL